MWYWNQHIFRNMRTDINNFSPQHSTKILKQYFSEKKLNLSAKWEDHQCYQWHWIILICAVLSWSTFSSARHEPNHGAFCREFFVYGVVWVCVCSFPCISELFLLLIRFINIIYVIVESITDTINSFSYEAFVFMLTLQTSILWLQFPHASRIFDLLNHLPRETRILGRISMYI